MHVHHLIVVEVNYDALLNKENNCNLSPLIDPYVKSFHWYISQLQLPDILSLCVKPSKPPQVTSKIENFTCYILTSPILLMEIHVLNHLWCHRGKGLTVKKIHQLTDWLLLQIWLAPSSPGKISPILSAHLGYFWLVSSPASKENWLKRRSKCCDLLNHTKFN